MKYPECNQTNVGQWSIVVRECIIQGVLPETESINLQESKSMKILTFTNIDANRDMTD